MNDWSLKSDFLNPLRFSFPFPSPSVLQSNSQKKPCVMWQQSCRMFVRIVQKLCSHQSFCSQHSDLFEIQPTIKCNVSLRLIRLSNFCGFFFKVCEILFTKWIKSMKDSSRVFIKHFNNVFLQQLNYTTFFRTSGVFFSQCFNRMK